MANYGSLREFDDQYDTETADIILPDNGANQQMGPRKRWLSIAVLLAALYGVALLFSGNLGVDVQQENNIAQYVESLPTALSLQKDESGTIMQLNEDYTAFRTLNPTPVNFPRTRNPTPAGLAPTESPTEAPVESTNAKRKAVKATEDQLEVAEKTQRTRNPTPVNFPRTRNPTPAGLAPTDSPTEAPVERSDNSHKRSGSKQ